MANTHAGLTPAARAVRHLVWLSTGAYLTPNDWTLLKSRAQELPLPSPGRRAAPSAWLRGVALLCSPGCSAHGAALLERQFALDGLTAGTALAAAVALADGERLPHRLARYGSRKPVSLPWKPDLPTVQCFADTAGQPGSGPVALYDVTVDGVPCPVWAWNALHARQIVGRLPHSRGADVGPAVLRDPYSAAGLAHQAADPAATRSVVRFAADHDDPIVRVAAALNPKASRTVLEGLALDPDRSVRLAAASHPRIAVDVLDDLEGDRYADVRRAAADALGWRDVLRTLLAQPMRRHHPREVETRQRIARLCRR